MMLQSRGRQVDVDWIMDIIVYTILLDACRKDGTLDIREILRYSQQDYYESLTSQ